MTTDPSWLYSTIAQSSAAIVAIVGGFITASVLMLMSEKRALQNQKAEKETHIKAIQKKRSALQDIYDTNEAERFLRNALRKYPDYNIPTLEEIFANYPSDYRKFFNKKILETEFIKLSFEQIKAEFFILKHADKIDMNEYDDFLEWAKPRVSTKEYIEIANRYNKYIERRKKSESTSNDASKLPSWASPWSRQLDIDKKERELKEEEKHRVEQDNIYSGIEKLDDQLSLLSYELENLNSHINAFNYPPNLGWGILILGYLAAFGILLPVLIIANETFFAWASALTTVSFWLGILGVFTYVVFQIRMLRRK